VKPEQVRQRFEMLAGRVRSTRYDYWRDFRMFAEAVGLWKCSRTQLRTKGKELLVPYLNSLSDRSRTTIASRIKKVWRKGLDLPWPVETDELAPSAKPRRMKAPRRETVEPWVHAARNERDLYERSWFLVELNHGLRPVDQQAELRRSDVVYNEATNKPLGVYAEAPEHGFKRDSDLLTPFSPEEAEAVEAWLKVHPDGSADAYIWPHRNFKEVIDPKHPMTQHVIERMRRRFAKRWNLPWLTSKDMRHFVRTVLNESGMPAVERNYWQGHAPDLSNMDERYGDRTTEEILASQQRYLPNGPIGIYAKVEAVQGVPSEVVDIYRRLRSKEMDASDAVEALKALLRQQEKAVLVRQ
jgi:integrase